MAANLQFKSTPLRERVSKEEWDVRVDLAAAYQLAAIFKWTDLIYTHFSARVPGAEDFLVNPYGLMFDEITASNLVKVDPHGKVLDDPTGLAYNEAGFVIHGCMHEARPEINCVLHTHTRAGVAVSAHKCGLLPISQHAMILRNHGLLTLGETVREAFELMYYLDCACQIQIDAMAGGLHNVQLMSKEAADMAAQQFGRESRPAQHKDWPALLRLLDRKGIRYQD